MVEQEAQNPEFKSPFGSILGSYEGIEIKSNGFNGFDSRTHNFNKSLYTGVSFQSHEFIKRWLQEKKGLNFQIIESSFELWEVKYFERISDCKFTSFERIENGSFAPPTFESILVWKKSEDLPSGHSALISEVNLEENYVRIVEQNYANEALTSNFSRQLSLEVTEGKYWVKDSPHEVLGWIIINFQVDNEDLSSEKIKKITQPLKLLEGEWLDSSYNSQKCFGEMFGFEATRKDEVDVIFYTFKSDISAKICSVIEELNLMCLYASDKVIQSDELLSRFGLPQWTWEKIRKSWQGPIESGQKALCARFDFGFNNNLVKMFEFNSDSAGCILETGVIFEQWAKAVGCDIEEPSTGGFERLLVDQSQKIFTGHVHIMIDNDPEEIYNGYYMQEVFTKAGLSSTIVLGLDFSKNEFGKYVDRDGVEIKTVWKMWNWETIVSDFEKPRIGDNVKISDVMVNDDIFVQEPIWKLVTSNKALMPVMCELWPAHPYMLRTEWHLDETLREKGYARKPIVGRCGENVEIFLRGDEKIEINEGHYANRDFIYQELFTMKKYEEHIPILGAWVVGLKSAGFLAREDTKLITNHESHLRCVRIVN